MGNLALNKPTTASSFVMPYTAAKAVNGTTNPLSRWLCNKLPGWMSVDLGAMFLVNRWAIKNMPVAGWLNPDYTNSDFRLQGSSDNISWADIDLISNNTSAVVDRSFSPVFYRYFRVYVTKGLRINPKLASIMELELYQAYTSQLTGLAISSGILTPPFNPNINTYTATVSTDVASINVTPTALSPTAVIKVNGTVVASGRPSPVALNFGSTAITVNVIDGTTAQNYTITVTRPASNYLNTLTVLSQSGSIQITPSFVKTTQNYAASVDNNVTNVTFTPTAESSSATITINGTPVTSGQVSPAFNLTEGNNTYSIVVTAGGANYTYTVVIVRAYNLLLNKADIVYTYRGGTGSSSVTMDSTNLNYSVKLPNNSSSMTIAPFTQSTKTVLKVNGVVVHSGSPSTPITITSGMVISITVSSPDNTQIRSYTLTVIK